MASNSSYVILPLHWGSRDIILADWIALFTLGLAPLIAHLVSGAPRPSYLSHHRPRWHDRLCTYNPASIVWRYAAITDRRIRSSNWGIYGFAASNALFWTAHGWDGSESMAFRCQPYAIRLPQKPTVDIFSMEMLKTVIALLQGIQALACIIGNFGPTGNYTTMDTVNGLFMPIAFCGLLRLCAAFWLTDDFTFEIISTHTESFSSPSQPEKHAHRCSVDSLQVDYDEFSFPTAPVNNSRSWGSIAFRTFYMIPFLGSWCLTFLYITPWMGMHGRIGVWTTTSWLLGLYYMTLITPMTIIMGYYSIRGPLTTTIIPCISTWWYKTYSTIMALFTVVLIVVAAIETHKTVCGKYSSLASKYGDPCANGGDLQTFHLGLGATDGFGVAQRLNEDGHFTVVNFTGQCLGLPVPGDNWRNATML